MTVPADPLAIEPPDDTGSDTFARFRYQARVVLPYCLNMLLERGVLCVVPEHIEDVAIERASGWTFVQIKTRDPALGPWRIAALAGADGGLQSLWRSYGALNGLPATFELHVEGNVARGDAAEQLLTTDGIRTAELSQYVAERLGGDPAIVTTFLGQVVVRELPLRRSIRAENLHLLSDLAPGLTAGTLAAVHDGIVDQICAAMGCDVIGESWPRHVLDPTISDTDTRARVERKRLTQARLIVYRRLLLPVPQPAPLTRSDRPSEESAGQSPSEPTDLTRKLREAGASQDLIQQARHLRAAAVRHEFELFARTFDPRDPRLDDVQQRLLVEAIASSGIRRGQPNAAANVFNDVRTSLHANRGTIDPSGLFGQDPMLLLGELCELSDQCLTDWGA